MCCAGLEELQLVMECSELYAAVRRVDGQGLAVPWAAMWTALAACPYPALVEFNTRHGRNLLTLAERSLEAALAPGGDDSSAGGSSSSGVTGGTGGHGTETRVAAQLVHCLTQCLHGGPQAKASAAAPSTYEAKGGCVGVADWGRSRSIPHCTSVE
jgi:hypothetical protein